MRSTLILSALALAPSLQAQMPYLPPVNPLVQFIQSLAYPYEGNQGPYLVVGGSLNYSTSSYPQYLLYDLFAANLVDADEFGDSDDLSRNSEQFKNYFWGAYGGYHAPVDCNWDIGIELGYKKLLRTHTATNIIRHTIPSTGPFPRIPFRDTATYVWDLMVTARYTTCGGFNVFAKAGGARVHTRIKEGNFIALGHPDFDDENAFSTALYNLVNIYPEIEVGAGFRFLDHFDVHLSYAKIFAPEENDLRSPSLIFYRPRRAPSLDLFMVSLEMLIF